MGWGPASVPGAAAGAATGREDPTGIMGDAAGSVPAIRMDLALGLEASALAIQTRHVEIGRLGSTASGARMMSDDRSGETAASQTISNRGIARLEIGILTLVDETDRCTNSKGLYHVNHDRGPCYR